MALTNNAKFLLKERYCASGETPTQVFDRVAEALSLGDDKFEKHLRNAMKGGYFLPASPTLRNAGFKKTLLHPCHVLPIDDSIDDIMRCLRDCATIFHYGGGVGFNISKLRPKGAELSTGGSSSGVVSFLGLFDNLTDVVKQGGFRRGALMAVLDYHHPEIVDFITAKLTGKLTNFNISVMVDDFFMAKVEAGESIRLQFNGQIYNEIKASDLFDQIVFCAYMSGDPGLLFSDSINEDNKLIKKFMINATNPCGEVPLPDYTCCNLGAINLSKCVKKNGTFDMNKFSQYVAIGMRTLKNINAIGWYPFPQMTKNMKILDPCGLGFFGLADALIKMGIYYDSIDCINFLEEISKPYVKITEKIGKGSFYKRSQQPTGSLSIIADCSPGIEPVFARKFKRHLTIGVVEEVKKLYESKYCQTAHEIEPIKHLAVQAQVQSFVDAGVSKTVNMPNESSIDDVRTIYKTAYELGCKGITVFRENSKEGVMRKSKCDDEGCYL